jgi:single-strand DNA-binding protein
MLNKVILLGRLTRDPELRSTPQGVSTCSFSIAVDRNFVRQGEERKADFINCVAWRQTAEFISKYFKKGSMVALEGSIQTRSWDDQDGKKRYATDVVVSQVYFAESKKDGAASMGPDIGEIPDMDEFNDDLPF